MMASWPVRRWLPCSERYIDKLLCSCTCLHLCALVIRVETSSADEVVQCITCSRNEKTARSPAKSVELFVLRCEFISCYNLQAKKRFPQLAEHAARMKCGNLPPGSLTKFMHSMLQTRTAPNYDNVIATSSFLSDEDEEKGNEPKATEAVRECVSAVVKVVAGGHGGQIKIVCLTLPDCACFVEACANACACQHAYSWAQVSARLFRAACTSVPHAITPMHAIALPIRLMSFMLDGPPGRALRM